MTTLNLVGAGRVGQTLARLWHQQGSFVIQDVRTTTLASAQTAVAFIGAGTPVHTLQAMRAADVWMLAVPDAQLGHVALELASTQTALADVTVSTTANTSAGVAKFSPQLGVLTAPVAFHCSGAQSAALLEPLAALGWHAASAHCILSFATPQAAIDQFPGTVCALEGDAAACAALHPFFTAIGAQCFGLASEHKLLYHAAAVFATNFLPVLQSVAEDAWQSTGVPTHLLPGLRASLLHHAVANITALGPAAALTGPAARGDTAAMAQQSAKVSEWDPLAGAAYDALSTLARRMAVRRG